MRSWFLKIFSIRCEAIREKHPLFVSPLLRGRYRGGLQPAASHRTARRSLLASRATVIALLAAAPAPAFPHAFPLRADPRVGSTVAAAPAKVTIWFDSEIEEAFSKIEVYDAAERRVDQNDPRVDASRTALEVDLSPLPPGKYQVRWTALSIDTHVTEGRFTFTVGR